MVAIPPLNERSSVPQSATVQPTVQPATAPLTSLQPTAVLLDLDGTISDSGTAITTAIAETLEHFGYPAQRERELLRFVGPPIRDGFREFVGVSEERLETVVADYRARYLQRMNDAPVFPGMTQLIADLHRRGIPLALATSKRRSLAVEIIAHDGLSEYFTVQCGASEDETRAEKADIVADALAGLREAGADLDRAIMVGNRHHDVAGALTHGIDVVLVTWGYASPGEGDRATAVARDVDELTRLLAT